MEWHKTKAQNGFINLKVGGYLAYTPWDTLLLVLGGGGRACFLCTRQNIGRHAARCARAVRIPPQFSARPLCIPCTPANPDLPLNLPRATDPHSCQSHVPLLILRRLSCVIDETFIPVGADGIRRVFRVLRSSRGRTLVRIRSNFRWYEWVIALGLVVCVA